MLLALNNEVSDVHLLISEVKDLIDSQPAALPGSLNSCLGRIEASLLELESLVAYELTIPTKQSTKLRIDRSAFIRLESRIHYLKEKIRLDRNDLNSTLAA